MEYSCQLNNCSFLAGETQGYFVNIVDLDQLPQNVASDQGLHCLHYIQELYKMKHCSHKNKPDTLLLEIDWSKELWWRSPLDVNELKPRF